MWLLFTDKPEEAVRIWDHEALALAQLREEGWEISGPYAKKQSVGFYG
jgi:hypothetical protein